MKYINRLLIAIIIILSVLLLYFSKIDTFLFEYLNENISTWNNYVRKNYFIAVLLYLIVYIFASWFLSILTLPLTMLGGLLFNPIPATIYSIIASTLSATVVYLFFKYLIGDFIKAKYHDKIINFNENIKKNGTIYLLILRLILITPFFLVNILASFTNISLFTFIWTTALGILPATAIYSFMGNYFMTIKTFNDIFTWNLMLLYIIFTIIILLPIILKTYKLKKI